MEDASIEQLQARLAVYGRLGLKRVYNTMMPWAQDELCAPAGKNNDCERGMEVVGGSGYLIPF